MKKVVRRRPSAAMIVAMVALVVALGGTAVAAKKLGLGAFKNGTKNKTVGVGKLTYVTATATDPAGGGSSATSVACPSGLRVIGGGIKGSHPDEDFIFDSYPTTSGWAGRVQDFGPTASTFTITAICAASRVVTGAPPSS
jgi:hypothetical protein